MENIDKQEIVKEIQTDVKILFGSNTPKEIEESLFQIFEEAYLFGEPEQDERTRRSLLHHTLRKILRKIQENPELLKTLTS